MCIYNVPSLRHDSGLDLSSLVAPFTELHFHSGIHMANLLFNAKFSPLIGIWNLLSRLSNVHVVFLAQVRYENKRNFSIYRYRME
jgi:hypothetical protein